MKTNIFTRGHLAFFILVAFGLILSACNAPASGNNGVAAEPLVTSAVPLITPQPEATKTPWFTNPFAANTPAPNDAPVSTAAVVSAPGAPTAAPLPAADPDKSEAKTLSEACWAYDPAKHEAFLRANMVQNADGIWEVDFSKFLKYAEENNGAWQFEGRLPEYRNEDRTDILFPSAGFLELGKFYFVEGSFWLLPLDCAGSLEGMLIANDRTAIGKWRGREEQGKLEGFTLVVHDPSDDKNGWSFTVANPYKAMTVQGAAEEIKSCKNLKSPQPQNFFGQPDFFENYSFGAIGCNSATIGNFEDGYYVLLIKNANDNISVNYDEKLQHWLFPADWSASMISDWLATNYPGVNISDPEMILAQ